MNRLDVRKLHRKPALVPLLFSLVALAAGWGPVCRAEESPDPYDGWNEENETVLDDPFDGVLHNSVPQIESVTQTPADPAAGQETRIAVRFDFRAGFDPDPAIVRAWVNYSVDGAVKAPVEMREGPGGDFSAALPGQPSGSAVSYWVRAEDRFGNVATEAPGKAVWSDLRSTLAPGARDRDNDPALVPDDVDIIETGIGYDDDWIYASFRVQGSIGMGTLDPPYIHIYGVKFTNPDSGAGEGLTVGKAILDFPIAAAGGLPLPFPPVAFADMNKLVHGDIAGGIMAEAEPERKAEGGLYAVRFRRGALGDNPGGSVRMLAMTVANGNLDGFVPVPVNCSPFTQFYMRTHGYTVK